MREEQKMPEEEMQTESKRGEESLEERVEEFKKNIAGILGSRVNRVHEEADNLYHDESVRKLAKGLAIGISIGVAGFIIRSVIMGLDRAAIGAADDINNTVGLLHLNNVTDLGGFVDQQNPTANYIFALDEVIDQNTTLRNEQIYNDRIVGVENVDPHGSDSGSEEIVTGREGQDMNSRRLDFDNSQNSGLNPVITDKDMSFKELDTDALKRVDFDALKQEQVDTGKELIKGVTDKFNPLTPEQNMAGVKSHFNVGETSQATAEGILGDKSVNPFDGGSPEEHADRIIGEVGKGGTVPTLLAAEKAEMLKEEIIKNFKSARP